MPVQSQQQWSQEIVDIIPDIRRWIHRFTGNIDDTNEVLQQTLVKALQNLASFSEPFNLRAWLMTIARNQSYTYLRERKKLSTASTVFLEQNMPVQHQPLPDLPGAVESMRDLPYQMQLLLFMRYFTHHKVSEISKLLKIPEGSVKRQLHNARQQLKKEMTTMKEEPRTAPQIHIEEVHTQHQHKIKRAGYGLFFGSPLKGVGDVELVEGYEHPGRIHTFEAQCKVTRVANMLGQEVWETHNTYAKRSGEKERFLYYTISEDTMSMPFRVFHYTEPDKVRIDIEEKEMVPPIPLSVVAPSSEVDGTSVIERQVVHVSIGEKTYENCIRIRSAEDDYHGRSYTESFLNQEGREILHRSFISQGWKMGGFVTWEKWKDAPEVEFHGDPYRLWFEFILVGTRAEE